MARWDSNKTYSATGVTLCFYGEGERYTSNMFAQTNGESLLLSQLQ